MKVRPANATIGAFVTSLGGTNVQASAPEARDMLERGVADAITFPWGSIILFGIDKVVKYHMDVPFYDRAFVWVMNKAKVRRMSAAQKKVIDDHCTTEWAEKVASPWADWEHGGRDKMAADPATRSTSSRPSRLAAGARRREPLKAKWAAQVKDADAVFDELQAELKKPRSQLGANEPGGAQCRSCAGNRMDRFIDGIELLAAVLRRHRRGRHLHLGAAALLLHHSIPDSYDFGRLLLGILIFWGIAATSYRGTHITVDLVWAAVGPARQAADRHLRDAGAAVRRERADRDAVRQGAR